MDSQHPFVARIIKYTTTLNKLKGTDFMFKSRDRPDSRKSKQENRQNVNIITNYKEKKHMLNNIKTRKFISFILALVILSTSFVIAASATNYNYNPSAAASYALKYAYSYNPNYTSYKGKGGDCANFVSQCLYNGGIAKTSSWKPGSTQWINCGGLKTFLCSTLGCKYISQPSASQIDVGDVMYYNNGSHVCIVSKIENGVPKVCGHTTDTKNGSYKQGYSTYGVIKLSNTTNKTKKYTLNLSCYLDGSYRSNISGIATADIYINGKLVGNDVTDFCKSYPAGTTYKITDIRTKSGYRHLGSSSYSGTIKNNANINPSFYKVVTYFTTNFRMKSGAYTTAYSSYTCSSSVGRIYPGDVISIKKVYSNGIAQIICPWTDSSGSYNKTVYCKVSGLKFKATKYINAYDLSGSYIGRVYPNDLVSVAQIYSNNTLRVFCPWTGGYQREILISGSAIY